MTADELSTALDAIQWTPEILALALECDVSLVNAWLDGSADIPMKAGVWIKVLAEAHIAADEGRPRSLKGKRFLQ